MKMKIVMRLTCLSTAMCLVMTGVLFANSTNAPSGTSIAINEPGFEAAGTWKFGKTGAGVKGFFAPAHQQYLKAGLIDPLEDCGRCFAYNNGTDHDLYQVLTATVAANTTYKLSIIAIDPTFANPFPGGELRLGYVSDTPAKADDYGLNLIKPTKIAEPTPFNDKTNSPENRTDGLATWTYTFTTGASPAGLGKQLRIEVLGGGKAQSIFDNVSLDAIAATGAEIKAASNIAVTLPETPPVVVMLGDSTTDGGMTIFVKKQLDKLITSERKRPKVINAGKGGDYAANALKRLQKDVLSHNPDIVTVSFGLNDTGLRKPDEYKQSLLTIVKQLQDADIKVIMMTSTPFNNARHFWAKRKEYKELGGLDEYMNKEFCDRMRAVARDKNLVLCDLHRIFTNEFKKDPGLINKFISGDGVHLTQPGYVFIAKHLAPVIQKMLAAKQ